jgi:hypothetical protein
MRILSTRPEWSETPVVAALAGRARALVDDDDVAAQLTPSAELLGPDGGVAAAVRRFMAGAA